MDGHSHFVVAGLTIQHCVKKSTEQLVKYLENRGGESSITVVRELVSGRERGKKRENTILDGWMGSLITIEDTWEKYNERVSKILVD